MRQRAQCRKRSRGASSTLPQAGLVHCFCMGIFPIGYPPGAIRTALPERDCHPSLGAPKHPVRSLLFMFLYAKEKTAGQMQLSSASPAHDVTSRRRHRARSTDKKFILVSPPPSKMSAPTPAAADEPKKKNQAESSPRRLAHKAMTISFICCLLVAVVFQLIGDLTSHAPAFVGVCYRAFTVASCFFFVIGPMQNTIRAFRGDVRPGE